MRFIENRVLLDNVAIGGLNSDIGGAVWVNFGDEPVTFVGYPSENGNGTVGEVMWMYGINGASDNKDNAWGALCEMMTNENFLINRENSGISPVRSFLDRCYNDKEGKMSSSSFRSIYSVKLDESSDDPTKNISQERVDQIYDFICNARFDPYQSFELNSIFNEEADYVLGDERSASQAAAIIQDRISTYLAENN